MTIDSKTLAAIKALPNYREITKIDLDIERTLDFYARRYVHPLNSFMDITSETVLADLGAGVGWLALALASETPAQVMAVELDERRVAIGREMARLLGLGERITWKQGGLGSTVGPLPLDDQSVDAALSIEVVEHVFGDRSVFADMTRVTRELLVVTTPNKWFPAIAHDTRLPFCHWLPPKLRDVYARACGRAEEQRNNIFWSPAQLSRGLKGFKRVSGFLNYQDLAQYKATMPYYLPYDVGTTVTELGSAKNLYYTAASKLGPLGAAVMPNMGGVFRRIEPDSR